VEWKARGGYGSQGDNEAREKRRYLVPSMRHHGFQCADAEIESEVAQRIELVLIAGRVSQSIDGVLDGRQVSKKHLICLRFGDPACEVFRGFRRLNQMPNAYGRVSGHILVDGQFAILETFDHIDSSLIDLHIPSIKIGAPARMPQAIVVNG
jgi:hypothetical protein